MSIEQPRKRKAGKGQKEHVGRYRDFFKRLYEEVGTEPFLLNNITFGWKRHEFRVAVELGLIVRHSRKQKNVTETRWQWRLTDDAAEYIEDRTLGEEPDTICPCNCLKDGVLNREDGYYCPNQDCNSGPWNREELNA